MDWTRNPPIPYIQMKFQKYALLTKYRSQYVIKVKDTVDCSQNHKSFLYRNTHTHRSDLFFECEKRKKKKSDFYMCSTRTVHSFMCVIYVCECAGMLAVPASSRYINNTHSATMIWKISGADLSLIRELPNNNSNDNGSVDNDYINICSTTMTIYAIHNQILIGTYIYTTNVYIGI